jgi:hypothetical protein
MKIFNFSDHNNNKISPITIFPLLFLLGRILFYFALMPNDLRGLGDFPNYFNVVSLDGLPYFNYWTEYPPIFAFILELINYFAQNNQFIFDFILYLFITISGTISIYIFSQIASKIRNNESEVLIITTIYFSLLAFLSYSWWYFDLAIVCLILFALWSIIKNEEMKAGIWIGLGILTKWFPLILIPAIFKFKNLKSFLKIFLLSISIVVVVWLLLFVISPEMTNASLISQPSRSSWQTMWALIDGNLNTGAFIPLEFREIPSTASTKYGNSAIVPTWLTLLVFSCIGLIIMKKIRNYSHISQISFAGITWVLFFLWSPGWSPQWILYLIPIILITLPINQGLIITFTLSIISLVEWPVLLGRHFFNALWIIVPLRILIFIILIYLWYRIVSRDTNKSKP